MIFDTTAQRLQELEKNKKITDLTEKDIKNFYEQALRLKPLMLINILVDKIIVFEDKIEIHFYTPKLTRLDE